MHNIELHKRLEKEREKLLKRLPPEQFDYDAVFKRMCDTEKRRHHYVKHIHVLSGNEPDGHQELLTFVGFPNAEVLFWNCDDSLEYSKGEIVDKGGFVKSARLNGEAKISTFVFLKCNESETESAQTRACVLIGVLMHEMGHVDDIERGKNLRFDGVVDLVAAEEYARRYASRRMMRENLRFPLAMLLGSMLWDVRHGGDDSVKKAASARIVNSGEYKQFRQFVGDLVDVEGLAEKS
jgi:hypothetical protein